MYKTMIIAECGVNHNGSLELAKEMIFKAKECGADYVKFQTAIPELVISKFAPKADYQKVTTEAEESQLEMCKRIHLPLSDYQELKVICDHCKIGFLSTPFDLPSIDCLEKINIEKWKVPSGEMTNLPYLIKIAKTRKPVIMSTGMCTLQEIDEALAVLKKYGAEDIALLHCNTEYPTPYEDVNLSAMLTLKRKYGLMVGYSDHTVGIEVPIAAVAFGAEIIEKHFTLDRDMEGPDHKASIEPDELKMMIRSIRNIEKAIGDGVKVPSKSELKNIPIARKSIVAAKPITKGQEFTEENITVKRPGTGISPMQWFTVLGRTAIRNFKEDEMIEL